MPRPDHIPSPPERILNASGDGRPFDHDTIRRVWEKAVRQPGFETFSIDHRGTSISLFEYGRRSTYGWVIEHIVAPVDGGSDELANLRPLHWKHLQDDPAGHKTHAPGRS